VVVTTTTTTTTTTIIIIIIIIMNMKKWCTPLCAAVYMGQGLHPPQVTRAALITHETPVI
jgi:hypothetical protein